MSNVENMQHKFMIGLIYPSFLGSVIYNIVDKFNHDYIMNNPLRYVVFILILILYIMDYLYTDTDEVKAQYNKKQFLLDFVIVILLYFSIVVILNYNHYPDPEYIILLTLFFSKFINLFWEYSRPKKESFAILLYVLYSIVYLIGIVYFKDFSLGYVFLIIVLVSDIGISINYFKLFHIYHSLTYKKDRIIRKIEDISYPFLDEYYATDSELNQVHNIAKYAYMQNDDESKLFNFQTLKKLYTISPTSWIIVKKENTVIAYAHAEVVQETTLFKLQTGFIDEKDFKTQDIFSKSICQSSVVIHIGSLVVAKNINFYNTSTIIFLLACTLDRILKYMVEYQTTKVFAVEYEDANARSHFKHKLKRYGFEPSGHTKTGNCVFIIDISSDDSYFSFLLYHMAKIHIKHYKDNTLYLKNLYKIFPDLK